MIYNSDRIVICAVSSKHLPCVCRHTMSYPANDRFLYHTEVNMVITELYKPRATNMNTLGENEEFSKLKTTKLFYFTRDSRLIFQS